MDCPKNRDFSKSKQVTFELIKPNYTSFFDHELYRQYSKQTDDKTAYRESWNHTVEVYLPITSSRFYYIHYNSEYDEYQYQVFSKINGEIRREWGEKYCWALTKRSEMRNPSCGSE